TTWLKLSKVPNAICRAVPPFGASALTYSKCLNPAEYFKSPNDDTPCRQFLSSANAAPIERNHVSGRAATASRVEPSSNLRFIRPLEVLSCCKLLSERVTILPYHPLLVSLADIEGR